MNPKRKIDQRPGNNNGYTMKEIRFRKKKLKDDLELLEGNFEKRVHDIRERILGPFRPVLFIKKKPMYAMGIAVAAGIALGFINKGGKKKKNMDQQEVYSSSESSPGFTGILFDEIKRIAARRAASYVSDFVDQKFSEKK